MRKEKGLYMECSGNGSITLFLALILTLILSFLFSLLEAARVQCIAAIAQRDLLLSLESVFGEYDASLWQNYRVLFLDGSDDAGQLDMALLEGHMLEESYLEQKGVSFYQTALKNLEITGYALATDYAGAAFEEQACKAIQEQLAAGAVDALQEKLGKGEEMAEESDSLETQWDLAKNAVKEAEESETEAEGAETGMGGTEDEMEDAKSSEGASSDSPAMAGQELPENPMDAVDLLKKSPILALAVENPSQISGKGISLEDNLRSRTKETGNMEKSRESSIQKLWFLQYLNHYFSCQAGPGKGGSESHALDYELEYCIGGKETDRENLEQTVKELLLIREVGNFATIMQDSGKQALALEIATAAVGFTGIAPLIQAVKIGILLAWSYIESILDVRNLLAGGTVSLVKDVTEWKSDISLGEKSLEEKTKKAEEKEGLSYREYLQILLLLVKEDVLVYRAMDVVEHNMRMEPGKENFRMDNMIYAVQAEALYGASPLFLGFVTSVKISDGMYHFNGSQQFSYLK